MYYVSRWKGGTDRPVQAGMGLSDVRGSSPQKVFGIPQLHPSTCTHGTQWPCVQFPHYWKPQYVYAVHPMPDKLLSLISNIVGSISLPRAHLMAAIGMFCNYIREKPVHVMSLCWTGIALELFRMNIIAQIYWHLLARINISSTYTQLD